MSEEIKKRDIVAVLNRAILSLTAMCESALILETKDNGEVSKRLSKAIRKFETQDFKPLKQVISSTRKEILSRPKKVDGRTKNKGPYSGKSSQAVQ